MDKDKQLIEAILKGQNRALYVFYQDFKPLTLQFIKSRVAEPADAEEILQDTLLAVLEGLADFTYHSSLKTYVLAIAKRKIVDYYRRQKLKTLVFSKVPQAEQYLVLFKNPQTLWEEKLLAECLKKVFRRLRPKYRQLIKLKYIEQLTVKQIAKKLQQSVKAVESRLFRARKSFVKLYEQEKKINFERPTDSASP